MYLSIDHKPNSMLGQTCICRIFLGAVTWFSFDLGAQSVSVLHDYEGDWRGGDRDEGQEGISPSQSQRFVQQLTNDRQDRAQQTPQHGDSGYCRGHFTGMSFAQVDLQVELSECQHLRQSIWDGSSQSSIPWPFADAHGISTYHDEL